MDTSGQSEGVHLPSKQPDYFWKKPGYQILLTLLFALATGHAWSIRGGGPWGGTIGMFTVGTIVVCLIYLFFGDRAKTTPAWAGILVVLIGLTTSGWGTFNSHLRGDLTRVPSTTFP